MDTESVGLLGHVSPVETYWCLTATPALLLTAATAFREYASLEEAK
jgi:integrase/recombinase XerD